MGAFLDTSALAKHYHLELGTAAVDRLWAEVGQTLYVSRVGAVEVISAFAGKVRQHQLDRPGFELFRRQFLADLAGRRPELIRSRVQHFTEAARLIRQHGLDRQLRTLDALQLATALDARARGLLDLFVCSDHQLLTIATAEGLRVLDLERP